MEQKSKRTPGRPRSYDRDEVVGRARRLFWKEGAEAPIDEVSEATGLHKPSLYSAFGGKRGLYIEALDGYLAESGRRIAEALARVPLRLALEAFFEVDLETFCGADGERGCFLISTAIEASADDPEVRTRVERAFSGMRTAILGRVREAVAAGELSSDADAELVTDLVTSTHVSLSVEARAETSREALEGKVRRIIDLIGKFV
jgi:AcrR family transcriptional regulator